MPSYVNIGAYVDEGTMVDTWATVGSCAQIGKNVHLSGGVGIGGVLEPLQANPTIIEDNCFIGARSEVVEGVIVEEGSVISMGVYIGQSTRIYDRETGEIHYGRVPAGSVVVSGNLPSKDGKYSLYCAVIVKKVDAKTRGKVGINELQSLILFYIAKVDVHAQGFSNAFTISWIALVTMFCMTFFVPPPINLSAIINGIPVTIITATPNRIPSKPVWAITVKSMVLPSAKAKNGISVCTALLKNSRNSGSRFPRAKPTRNGNTAPTKTCGSNEAIPAVPRIIIVMRE